MAIHLEQIGAELSVVRANAWRCEWNRSLHFCRTELVSNDAPYEPSSYDDLLHDVLMKGLRRGTRPFISRYAEEWIVALYGGPVGLRENARTGRGSITYSHDGNLEKLYTGFTNVSAPWHEPV